MTEHGPRWLGIGAQRCGTTWFTGLLVQHPLMDVADGKYEHHVLYRFGLLRDWNDAARERYQKKFDSDEQKLGEFTPYYLRAPWTPQVAKEALPEDAPLIVLLRDPVDRFASSLRHKMAGAIKRYRNQQEGASPGSKSPPAPAKKEPSKLLSRLTKKGGKNAAGESQRDNDAYLDEVARATDARSVLGPPTKQPQLDRTWLRYTGSDISWGGMYAAQLDAWTAVFPKDRFMVIQYEKLRRDPQHYADLVWKKIGLDPVPLEEADRPRGTTKTERWLPEDHLDVIRGVQRVYRADAERLAAEWDIDLDLWKRTMTDV